MYLVISWGNVCVIFILFGKVLVLKDVVFLKLEFRFFIVCIMDGFFVIIFCCLVIIVFMLKFRFLIIKIFVFYFNIVELR